MAKIRGCAVTLIIAGIIGIVAPLFGYQNKLISSASNELGIPYIAIASLAVIAGLVIIVISSRSYDDLETDIEANGMSITRNIPTDGMPNQKYVCPVCNYKMDKFEPYCPRCLNNISEENREKFSNSFSAQQEEIKSIINNWINHESLSSINEELIPYKRDLSNSLIKMIDTNRPGGLSPVVNNDKLCKLCNEVSTNIVDTGFYVGLDYASKLKKSIPVSSLYSIPRNVRNLFIIPFQDVNRLMQAVMSETMPLLRSDFAYFEKLTGNIGKYVDTILIKVYKKGIEFYQLEINRGQTSVSSIRKTPQESDQPPSNKGVNERQISYVRNRRGKVIGRVVCNGCGIEIWEGYEKCWKCGAPLERVMVGQPIVKDKDEKVKQVMTCPYCGKTASRAAKFCPYCFRDYPQQRNDFNFDFQKRQFDLIAIVSKWQEKPNFNLLSRHLSGISLPLMDAIFKLVDEGHQPGKETIKRNFDLSEKGAQASAAAMLAGFCLGLEYGENKKQTTPITGSSIPTEAGEMLIVIYQAISNFASSLLIDIVRVKKIDEKNILKMKAEFRDTAMGVVFNCYRLGVSTASE